MTGAAVQLEVAMASVLGLWDEQVTITVNSVEQRENDLNFGVYERLLSQKLRSLIGRSFTDLHLATPHRRIRCVAAAYRSRTPTSPGAWNPTLQ
jgi:hypothetical protein